MSTRSAKADNRRADIEQILTSHGIKFTYKGVVPVGEIERHKESQSRLRDTDKSLVKEYVEKMRQGAVFPPVILWEDGYDGYGIVDGNSRVEAKKVRKETTTDAYVIEVADANEAIYISAIFNATHGQKLSKEEIYHAIIAAGLMASEPTNIQLAKDYGITPNQVSRIQNVHRITGELTALGIDPATLTESAKYALSNVGDTAVKRDLASLIVDAGVPQGEIGHLVKEIGSKGSEAERLKVVSDARTVRAADIQTRATGRVSKHQPLGRIVMAIGLVASVMDGNPDPKQWVPVDADRRADLYPKVDRVRDFLDKVTAEFEIAMHDAAEAATAENVEV